MKISTAWSVAQDSASATHALADALIAELGEAPELLFFHATAAHDPRVCAAILAERFPQAKVHGSSTCIGVMTSQGFHSEDGCGMGALALHDVAGSYGVGAARVDGDGKKAAQLALDLALEQADMMGMAPALIWISAPPGCEEDVILGLEELVGAGVPIAGGSSADNEVAGKWWQICGAQTFNDAVVVAALFPSTHVTTSFHSGYTPTAHQGVITSATDRVVHTINNEPAAHVYDSWTGGAISEAITTPQNILARTTFHPLGLPVGSVGGATYFQLAHPEAVLPDGSLTLFARVEVGQTLVLMEGTPDSLATRAGRVAQSAMDMGELEHEEVAGALVIYCAGCMMGIQDRMEEVVASLRGALQDRPFLGTFTFGEQGCLVGGENRHGNLMISVLTFGVR